ncbi:MAG: bifunctional isocitrate dehydrogenase kinase/phosphatase, partial [Gemmatimonadales bacterium]
MNGDPAGPLSRAHPTAADPRPFPAAAEAIHAVFDSYQAQFNLVTRRSQARFESRDWRGAQQDAVERLTLYRQFLDWVVRDLNRVLNEGFRDPAVWGEIKRVYSRLVAGRNDAELAYTFFNSVSRRVLATAGVRPEVEYVDADWERVASDAAEPTHRTYSGAVPREELFRLVLRDLPFAAKFRDLEGDAALVAAALERDLTGGGSDRPLDTVEVLPSLFYRNKGAYLVGRLRRGGEVVPLLLPLVNTEDGIMVDAVLSTSDEASVVFSFTRSYFHVETDRPRAMIEFLRSTMPLKPLDELYTSIGYNKHGKTELYRALGRQLETPDTRFEIAEGDQGLVMSVFALPSLNVVFKIIKDHFGAPKNTTRRAVMDKYHLVFVRDRVGRLADAQEFEGLAFRRDCFAPELLRQLLAEAGRTVRVEGDRVVVGHLYTERRVTPLNLYLQRAPEPAALEAVLDYGQAIKDLAAANIFTGDMLLKNFGVTRHGRVIFYDYDELCLLTECHFREIPRASNTDDEMAAEPWFYVGERDVFPEE